jgi:hypothetical protein
VSSMSTEQNITKEERETILARVPRKFIERIDDDTLLRRQAQQKLLMEEEQKSRMKALTEHDKQAEIQRNNQEIELKGMIASRGWSKWGRLPNPSEKYYNEDKCIFGCNKKCAYLASVCPHTNASDSFTFPYSIENKDEFGNHPDLHVCKEISAEKIGGMISTLMNEIIRLQVQIAKTEQSARDYSILSQMHTPPR